MTKLVTTFALLGRTTAVAWADDAPADQTEAKPDAEEVADCDTLEGDEKKECEAKKAAAEEPADKPAKSGKSLQKSDDNRMESLDDE